MYKIVLVLSLAAIATCAPTPGYLHGAIALPAATSYSHRVDVHSAPIIKAYAAPIVTKAVVAAPLAYSVHSAPVISGYGLGYGGHGWDLGYGGYGGHGYGYSLGHGW